MTASIIAIDGPGASGKSSVGVLVAQRLGYRFIDTGSMYRALTWHAIRRRVDFADEAALVRIAEATCLEVLPSSKEEAGAVIVEGEDITGFLHEPEVDARVSLLARVPQVRQVLVAAQRKMAAAGGVVMVGRDIGEVVLPNAELKVYLDASVAERARRRFSDLKEEHHDLTLEEVLAELRNRDELDSTRSASPLRPAPGAIVVNTDGMTLLDVVGRLLTLAAR